MTDNSRRRFLGCLTAAVGGGGLVATAWMFVSSLRPAADKGRTSIVVDITKLKPGQILTVSFLHESIYILRRTEEMMTSLNEANPDLRDPQSIESTQPDQARNALRSIRPEIFVAYAGCTHLGCTVSYNPPGTNHAWNPQFESGAFFCPCHASVFDLAGRVQKQLPAPHNLAVPNYRFLDDNHIEIARHDFSESNDSPIY